MGSGAARSTPINDKTDRKKPSAWRKGNRKTRRSVNAVSIAQSENVFGAPGRPDGDGRHASVASAESPSVTSPRWTKACSDADQFPTRYFVLYFGWTFDLMSRSCTRSGHRGQRAYSCLVAAEGLCTNAPILQDDEDDQHDEVKHRLHSWLKAFESEVSLALAHRRTALVHDSKLTVTDPNPEPRHRPILYDSGRPSSGIWFRTVHATTDSATRPPRDRARRWCAETSVRRGPGHRDGRRGMIST